MEQQTWLTRISLCCCDWSEWWFPVALSLKDNHTTQLMKGLRESEFNMVFVRPGEAD
jgi:hypothetical protein